MAFKTLLFNCFIFSALVFTATAGCSQRWFGPKCQYQCHCKNDADCDDEGNCKVGCARGWFGPACQYYNKMHEKQVMNDWLHDDDDTTCNNDPGLQSVTVALDALFQFSWLRINVKNSVSLGNIDVSLLQPGYVFNCTDKKVAAVDDYTLDIHCYIKQAINDVVLTGTGVKDLCSLYISGGRNVALKQKTWQSSTFTLPDTPTSKFESSKAVDGDTNQSIQFDSCTCTDTLDSKPRWKVTFTEDMDVYQYLLYTRIDGETPKRLTGFILSGYEKNGRQVFRYTDNSGPNPVPVYKTPGGSSELEKIRQVHVDHDRLYLSLCEVQIYGDTVCPHGRFGRDCEKVCNCADQTEQCFVSTGGCPSGCASGYKGKACDVGGCEKGWFGPYCKYQCHCKHSDGCDGEGNCDGGCALGWFGPGCQYLDMAYQQVDITGYTARNKIFKIETWLQDGDDTHCNPDTDLKSIVMRLKRWCHFSWLRIHVRHAGALENIDVSFRVNGSDYECKEKKVAKVDSLTMDIHCNLGWEVSRVIFSGTGVKDLCSAYISGGRNIALKQRTWQSSTIVLPTGYNVEASNAVDGNTNGNVELNSCTHTDWHDPKPRWRVAFTEDAEVYLYEVYNRIGNRLLMDRLRGFTITVYDKNGTQLSHFKDDHVIGFATYRVTEPVARRAYEIEFEATNYVASYGKFLTLCEVQIYGDTLCPLGKYGRDCHKSCNCADHREQCLFSTGGCTLSGCAYGFVEKVVIFVGAGDDAEGNPSESDVIWT